MATMKFREAINSLLIAIGVGAAGGWIGGSLAGVPFPLFEICAGAGIGAVAALVYILMTGVK